MNNRFEASILFLIIAGAVLITAIMPVALASGGQSGTFKGSWIASGKRQPFEFVEGREVGTFNLSGNVSLKKEFSGIEDFWAECIGLSDTVSGGAARCVWRSLKGEKAYIVLKGQPMKKGINVTGEFVGGTGGLKGVSGKFTFTWTSTFIDRDQGIFTGHTRDLSGSYQIP